MAEEPNEPAAGAHAAGAHDERSKDGVPIQKPTDPPGSVLKDYLLLSALLLPLVLYVMSLHGRREDELLRFHREMISFADGAREALDAGTAVIFSAAHVEPDFKPAWCSEPKAGASYVRQSTGPRFVSIQQSFYAGLKRMPFRPCAISWTGSPGELTLHFSVDRPVSAPALPAAPESGAGTDAPHPEFRHRTSGHLDLHSRLAELAGLTGFDALLIADQSGELILQLGPSASLFSSLPLLNNDGWEKILEAKPAEKELSDVFVPSSIEQVERQVAGQDFTLFPREILLAPHQLLGSPYHCRAGQNGDSGQETLRLRAVGLVRTDRLTANALRPAEASYWYWCLSYLAAWLYILHRYRDDPTGSGAQPFSLRRLTVVLSFGLATGTLLSLLVYCWGLWCWEDYRLRELAESFRRNATRQLEAAAAAVRDTSSSPLVERFACVEGPVRGPYHMVRLQNGSRQELQPVFQPPLPFLQQPADERPWIEALFSLVDGRKTALLVQRDSERTRTAALSLLALDPAMFPAGFGAALVEAPGGSGPWPLLLDSEAARQTSNSFLAEFSNVDCVRLRVGEGRGYCSGRFRGHNARLRIDLLSPARLGPDERLLGRFRVDGDLLLVTYAYEELQNSQIEAATLAAVRLDLGLLGLALAGLFVFARRGQMPQVLRRRWIRIRTWLLRLAWHPEWLAQQEKPLLPLALAGGLVLGFASFAACWMMEARIYATITAGARENACRSSLARAADSAGSSSQDREARAAAIGDFLGCAAVTADPWPTDTVYYLLRPREGRLLASASTLSAGLAGGDSPLRFRLLWAGSWSTAARLFLLAAGLAATLGLLLVFADSRWTPPRPRLGGQQKPSWSWWGAGGLIAGALGLLISIVYFEKLALAVFTALTSLGVLKSNLLSHFENGERPKP